MLAESARVLQEDPQRLRPEFRATSRFTPVAGADGAAAAWRKTGRGHLCRAWGQALPLHRPAWGSAWRQGEDAGAQGHKCRPSHRHKSAGLAESHEKACTFVRADAAAAAAVQQVQDEVEELVNEVKEGKEEEEEEEKRVAAAAATEEEERKRENQEEKRVAAAAAARGDWTADWRREATGAVAAATVITAAAAAAVAASASAATGSVLQAQRVQKSASVGKKAAASSTSSSSENMLARLIKNAPDVVGGSGGESAGAYGGGGGGGGHGGGGKSPLTVDDDFDPAEHAHFAQLWAEAPSPKASHGDIPVRIGFGFGAHEKNRSWLEEQVRLFPPSLRPRAGTLNSAQFSGD